MKMHDRSNTGMGGLLVPALKQNTLTFALKTAII